MEMAVFFSAVISHATGTACRLSPPQPQTAPSFSRSRLKPSNSSRPRPSPSQSTILILIPGPKTQTLTPKPSPPVLRPPLPISCSISSITDICSSHIHIPFLLPSHPAPPHPLLFFLPSSTCCYPHPQGGLLISNLSRSSLHSLTSSTLFAAVIDSSNLFWATTHHRVNQGTRNDHPKLDPLQPSAF